MKGTCTHPQLRHRGVHQRATDAKPSGNHFKTKGNPLMKELICRIFGHKWSEKQYVGGDTTRWRRACERCGLTDSDTLTLIEDARQLLADSRRVRENLEEELGTRKDHKNA